MKGIDNFMPNRIWSEELQKWVMVDEARFALQTKILDLGEYYESNNVEDCLQEIGEKIQLLIEEVFKQSNE